MTFSHAKRFSLAVVAQQARKRGRSVNGIARELKVSWKTCLRLLSVDTTTLQPRRRKARKCCARVATRRRLVARLASKMVGKGEHQRPAHPSAASIALALRVKSGITASESTVTRDLRCSDYVSRVRRRVPTKDPRVEAQRLAFCKKILGWNVQKTDSIVFSDEHWISINDCSGRRQWCKRRLKGKDLCTRQVKRLQNTARVQIWAAVGVGYKGPLVLFPQKGPDDDGFRLNGDSYVRRCLQRTVGDMVRQGRIFVQDGARPHVRQSVKQYLARKKLNWIQNWPPYSPDLNMIEPLWAELNRSIGKRTPKNLDELIAVAQESWETMPQSVIDAHCRHLRRRVREVAENGGAA